MGKVYGDDEVIKEAYSKPPGDRSVYINFDLLKDLPDEFEAVITKIKFDIKKDFADLKNGSFMPNPDLMYRIAEACGVSGGEKSLYEPLIEEIDINPMLCKGIEEEPVFRKMTVGYKVTKYSTRIQEDGKPLRSSPCTCAYHVWNRCVETWMKYPSKYETKFKRQSYFYGEMKFAQAKAETKSHLKSIRELVGLMTGYKSSDLVNGALYFAKIRTSREILKRETEARLKSLSDNHLNEPNILFSEEEEEESNNQIQPQTQQPPVEPQKESSSSTNSEKQDEPKLNESETKGPLKSSKRDIFLDVLKSYSAIIPDSMMESASKLWNWLEGNEDAEQNVRFWNSAIEVLKSIEKEIPHELLVKHSLY